MTVSRFNIRVYGLLLHGGRVLVSEEVVQGRRITKFPGGGLIPGEGTLDGLKREIHEELGLEAKHLEHFYTTDFFQPSAFSTLDQIISIYYTFEVDHPEAFRDGEAAPGPDADKAQHLRWLSLGTAQAQDVDLPIDRVVLEMLLNGAGR